MGRRGHLPNPRAIRRQSHQPTVEPIRPTEAFVEAPAPDEEWLPSTADAWGDYWRDEVSEGIHKVDLPVIVGDFEAFDGWQRMGRAAREQPFVEGSTGQVSQPRGFRGTHPAAGDDPARG